VIIRISLIDPRARICKGRGIGKVRQVLRGCRERAVGVLLIAKPRGGNARVRTEVVRG
jgi:hypothetical protein